MKLNLGCGLRKRDEWVNVDVVASCDPDVVCDLEILPWPWADNSVEAVLFHHSLEHLGQTPRVFLGIVRELYRVCRDGAEIEINVPHPRHDDFINDPTHVRAITPQMLSMFNREITDEAERLGGSNTPLAKYLDVDFVLTGVNIILAEPYSTQFADQLLTEGDLEQMGRELNNVAREYRMVLKVRKRV